MHITWIGENGLVLHIPAEELRRRELTAELVTEREMRALLKSAQLPEDWQGVELELFAGKGELLVFLRREESWAWYAFGDLEALLAGAAASETGQESRLYFMDGSYILGLSRGRAPRAEEFGRRLPGGKHYEAVLREHGKLICGENAVCCLAALA